MALTGHWMSRSALLAGASLLAMGTTGALAGSFGLHEQSAEALGESFAGVSAGAGGLSSMFWNPATLTQSPGIQTSSSWSLVLPRATDTFTGTNMPGAFLGIAAAPSPGGNIGAALIPSTYAGYQINDQWWAGVAINTPFGAATKNPFGSAASLWGLTTQLFTVDITPEVAYKLNNWISVGFGVQAMYAEARESQNLLLPAPFPPGTQATGVLTGKNWGFGVTAGVTLTPIDGTQIGIGYRSQVREDLKGSLSTSIPSYVTVNAPLTTPDSINIGLKQRITPQINLLAGVEWTNWSKLKSLIVTSTGTIAAPIPALAVVPGQVLLVQPLNYKDGWMFSLGGEYAYTPDLTLRVGVAYEQSPIDNSNRDVRILDANRVWASLGASYKVSNKLKLDLSYAHLFYQNGLIAIPASAGPPFNPAAYNGSVSAHADIVSVGLTYRWDEPVAPALVAKY